MLRKPRKNKRPHPKLNEDTAIRDQWRRHRKSVEKRGGDFGLDYEEFKAFVSRPCAYCGSLGTPKQKYGHYSISNGIDRIDNSKGYVVGNVAPCCKTCNQFKKGLTIDEVLAHVRLIAMFKGFK